MAVVEKSVLVPYGAAQMYALVDDVEKYPQFLPWCGSSRVVRDSAISALATVEIVYLTVRKSFTTRNSLVANERIDMELVEGPFSELDGSWCFIALGEGSCKVEFRLTYGFSSALLERLLGPVFHQIANSFIDSFTRRAQALYGP